MSARRTAARQQSVAERIGNLTDRLTAARSAVSIAAQALDHGDTDLELHSADVLRPAAESLDMVLNELIALKLDTAAQESA